MTEEELLAKVSGIIRKYSKLPAASEEGCSWVLERKIGPNSSKQRDDSGEALVAEPDEDSVFEVGKRAKIRLHLSGYGVGNLQRSLGDRLAPSGLNPAPMKPFDEDDAWISACHPDHLVWLPERLYFRGNRQRPADRQIYVPVPCRSLPELRQFWEGARQPCSFNLLCVPYQRPVHAEFLLAEALDALLGPLSFSLIGIDYADVAAVLPGGMGAVFPVPIKRGALPPEWVACKLGPYLRRLLSPLSSMSTLMSDERLEMTDYQWACRHFERYAGGRERHKTAMRMLRGRNAEFQYLLVQGMW